MPDLRADRSYITQPIALDRSRWISIHFDNGVAAQVPLDGENIKALLFRIGRLKNYHDKLQKGRMMLLKMENIEGVWQQVLEPVKLEELSMLHAGKHLKLVTQDKEIIENMRMNKTVHDWQPRKWINLAGLKGCRLCDKLLILNHTLECTQCDLRIHSECRENYEHNHGKTCFGRKPSHRRDSDVSHAGSISAFGFVPPIEEIEPEPVFAEEITPTNSVTIPFTPIPTPLPQQPRQPPIFFPGQPATTKYTLDTPGKGLEWFIQHQDITWGAEIGRGSYGTVFKCVCFGAQVAVKKLNISNPTEDQLNGFYNEIKILKNVRHDNCLAFRGYCETKEGELAIVTSFCDAKTLYHHLHVVDDKDIPSRRELVNVTKQIAHAMDYLTAPPRNIVHRDLKSPNIFLTGAAQKSVKIGDFGLSSIKKNWNTKHQAKNNTDHEDTIWNGVAGSILWMAPEICSFRKISQSESDTEIYTQKSDVYAFGVIMFEMYAGKLPYDGLNAMMILFQVGKGLLKPDLSQLPDDMYSWVPRLLLRCIELRPDKRPSFHEIAEVLGDVVIEETDEAMAGLSLLCPVSPGRQTM